MRRLRPIAVTRLSEDSGPVDAARQQSIEARMRWFDSLPPSARRVADGLPLPWMLGPALSFGCETTEDAEAWLRRAVGEP